MEKDNCSNVKKKRARHGLSALTVYALFLHTMLGIKCYPQNKLQGVLFLKPADFYLKTNPEEMKIFQGESKISIHAE